MGQRPHDQLHAGQSLLALRVPLRARVRFRKLGAECKRDE